MSLLVVTAVGTFAALTASPVQSTHQQDVLVATQNGSPIPVTRPFAASPSSAIRTSTAIGAQASSADHLMRPADGAGLGPVPIQAPFRGSAAAGPNTADGADGRPSSELSGPFSGAPAATIRSAAQVPARLTR
jgi:hypothetical protein